MVSSSSRRPAQLVAGVFIGGVSARNADIVGLRGSSCHRMRPTAHVGAIVFSLFCFSVFTTPSTLTTTTRRSRSRSPKAAQQVQAVLVPNEGGNQVEALDNLPGHRRGCAEDRASGCG